MINLIRKIVILLSVILIIYLGYQGFMNKDVKESKKYPKPQLASSDSFEEDEAILNELKARHFTYSSYKALDPMVFIKPSIFQTIQR